MKLAAVAALLLASISCKTTTSESKLNNSNLQQRPGDAVESRDDDYTVFWGSLGYTEVYTVHADDQKTYVINTRDLGTNVTSMSVIDVFPHGHINTVYLNGSKLYRSSTVPGVVSINLLEQKFSDYALVAPAILEGLELALFSPTHTHLQGLISEGSLREFYEKFFDVEPDSSNGGGGAPGGGAPGSVTPGQAFDEFTICRPDYGQGYQIVCDQHDSSGMPQDTRLPTHFSICKNIDDTTRIMCTRTSQPSGPRRTQKIVQIDGCSVKKSRSGGRLRYDCERKLPSTHRNFIASIKASPVTPRSSDEEEPKNFQECRDQCIKAWNAEYKIFTNVNDGDSCKVASGVVTALAEAFSKNIGGLGTFFQPLISTSTEITCKKVTQVAGGSWIVRNYSHCVAKCRKDFPEEGNDPAPAHQPIPVIPYAD